VLFLARADACDLTGTILCGPVGALLRDHSTIIPAASQTPLRAAVLPVPVHQAAKRRQYHYHLFCCSSSVRAGPACLHRLRLAGLFAYWNHLRTLRIQLIPGVCLTLRAIAAFRADLFILC
jgi:hypothetical protein